MDCFHCPYPDCIAPDRALTTQWERDVLKESLGGWEKENIVLSVQRMKKGTCLDLGAILARLGVTSGAYKTALKHVKSRFPVPAGERRKGKNYNTIIGGKVEDVNEYRGCR